MDLVLCFYCLKYRYFYSLSSTQTVPSFPSSQGPGYSVPSLKVDNLPLSKMMDIPVIDLHWDKPTVLNALQEALETVGFFKIKHHGMDTELIRNLYKASADFFSLDNECKSRVALTPQHPYGYEASEILSYTYNTEGTQPDPKETYNLNLHNNPLWPENMDHFKTTLSTYFTTMEELGMRLIGLFEELLHLAPGRLTDLYTSDCGASMLSLRLIKYAAVAGDEMVLRASEHTDYGVLTILTQDDIGGLQVNYKGAWCDVAPDADTFVINIGDMMMRMTEDKWQSTLHRVVGCRSQERYSNVMFVVPNEDAVITSLTGGGGKYPEITSKEYILSKFYITAIEKE